MKNIDNDFVPSPSKPKKEQKMQTDEYQNMLTLGRQLPITHEIQLNRHNKRITAIGLDPAGARLLTGSFDCSLKMWDFAAMDSKFKSFRELEVDEGYPINSISYDPQGVSLFFY